MEGLRDHHRHRGQGTKEGTPNPLRTYCLNVDNTAILKEWAFTTFASTGRRAEIKRERVSGDTERARAGRARR